MIFCPLAVRGRLVTACPGTVRQGGAWQARLGRLGGARRGTAGLGTAGVARRGVALNGKARFGLAGLARLGLAGLGTARHGRQGTDKNLILLRLETRTQKGRQ